MIIHFIRHTHAIKRTESLPDEHRFLSCRGRKRFRKVSGVLRKLGIDPEFIFTSPKIRAVQTADILAEKLSFSGEVIITPLLCDFTLQSLRELVQSYPLSKELILIGHDPDFSTVIRKLLNLSSCTFNKGGVVTLEVSLTKSAIEANLTSMITGGADLIDNRSKAVARLQTANP